MTEKDCGWPLLHCAMLMMVMIVAVATMMRLGPLKLMTAMSYDERKIYSSFCLGRRRCKEEVTTIAQ